MNQGKEFYRSVLRLAVPMLLQNLVNQALMMFDIFMVGVLGNNELAAATLANTPFFVLLLLVFGIQSGSSVLFSQYWGKKDLNTINRVLGLAIFASGGITLIVSTLIFIFPEQIMSITSNDPEVVRLAAEYGRWLAYAPFLNCFTLAYAAMQRSMENPKFGLVVLSISMTANVFFNWVFIFGELGAPRMGVAGAALGTLLSRVIEVIITIVYALTNKHFKLKWPLILRPGMVIFKDFVRYASPVILNESLWGLGFSLYPIIIGHLENAAAAVSAFTITGNIERLISVFMFAISGAASIHVGKAVGEGKSRDHIFNVGLSLGTLSLGIGIVMGAVLALLTFTFIEPVVLPLFKLGESIAVVRTMLLISCCALPFRAVNVTGIVGVLRGGGDVRASLYIDTGFMYAFGLPLASFLGLGLHLNVVWVYLVMNIEETLKGVVVVWRFMSRKWIKNITRDMPGEPVTSETEG